MPTLESDAREYRQQLELDDFNSYSASQRQRIRDRKRKEAEKTAGARLRIKWNGPFISSAEEHTSAADTLAADVRQVHELHLSKQQARKVTRTNERDQQSLKSTLRFNPNVYPIRTIGAYIPLMDEMKLVSQLYPSIAWWRLQFDGSGSGLTTVAISPVIMVSTQDLSPTNLLSH